MRKLLKGSYQLIRRRFQITWALLSNAYVVGFLGGRIYQGDIKAFCVPGLNCYACPGALGSCPIGSLQATLNAPRYTISTYVSGLLLAFGAALGRFVCGWLCPFGLLQDLLHRLKFPKRRKVRTIKGEYYLRQMRYVVLVVMVILLPSLVKDAFGQGSPWFCTWICPSGTLSGLLLLLGNRALRGAIGFIFAWKNLLLLLFLGTSLFIWRPFCRYVCPLGAIYGLFNKVALYRFAIDQEKCTKCGICQRACPMDIPVYQKPNSHDCVRCLRCVQACPEQAILHGRQLFTTRASVKNATD